MTARNWEITDKVFEFNAPRVPGRPQCELLRPCGAHFGVLDLGGD